MLRHSARVARRMPPWSRKILIACATRFCCLLLTCGVRYSYLHMFRCAGTSMEAQTDVKHWRHGSVGGPSVFALRATPWHGGHSASLICQSGGQNPANLVLSHELPKNPMVTGFVADTAGNNGGGDAEFIGESTNLRSARMAVQAGALPCHSGMSASDASRSAVTPFRLRLATSPRCVACRRYVVRVR